MTEFMKHVQLVLTLVLLPTLLFGQVPAVTVDLSGAVYAVHIVKATALSAVLDEFCRTSHTECQGTQNAAVALIAPATISGEWNQVVANLLEGTNLNYVAIEPPGSAQGTLEIFARPPASAAALGPQAQSLKDASFQAPPISVVEPTAEQEASSGNFSVGVNSEHDEIGSAAYQPGSGDLSAGIAVSVAPLPDSRGRPIAISNEPVQYLPIPDSQNRPIPVNHDVQLGMPFPDSHGNIIPLQPGPAGLPFPVQNH